MLAMPATSLVALAPLLFENNYLLVLFILEDSGLDRCAFYVGSAKLGIRTFAEHKDLIDINGVACLRIWKYVDFEDITFGYGKLPSLCLNGCFHKKRIREASKIV